jgi:uncharacterized protein (TIGR03382 family)
MLRSGLVLFVLALSVLSLGFVGAVRGAGHISSVAVLLSFALFAGGLLLRRRRSRRVVTP